MDEPAQPAPPRRAGWWGFAPDAALVLLLTAIAGVAAWTREGNLAWDDADYLRRGLEVARQAIARGNPLGVAVGLYDGFLGEQPKPPLLVCWIALSRLLIGPQTDLRPLIVLASALPFGLLAVSVWSVARLRYGTRAARLALLALGASPLALSYGAQVMVETLLGLTLLAVLATAARALADPRPASAAALGTALGLAMLTKLTIALVLPLPAVYVLWRLRDEPRVRDRRVVAALLLPITLIAGPWYARNGAEAVRFARFSARYHQVAEGRDTGTPRLERLEAMALGVAGGPALAAGMLAALATRRRPRPGTPPRQAPGFATLALLGASGGLALLLVTPYFAPRFLLPIWPALAVVLGGALAAPAGRPLPRPALAGGLLALGVLLSARSLAGEARQRTYWDARALLDALATRQGATTLANVGNGPDWNVCKTGLINELRGRPSDLFVLHDLSRGSADERARRLGRLDAVAILDASALPRAVVAGAPGLNRAHAETAAALASDPRFVRVTDLPTAGLPPLAIYVRRDRIEHARRGDRPRR
jgi:4-amino-4-deoxy-L-arabinose transferase-like glycosyltransferase